MGIDLQIIACFQQISKIGFFEAIEPLISKIGKGDALFFACILLAIFAYFSGKTKGLKTASIGMFTLLLSGFTVQLIKRLIGRARPGMSLGDFHFIGPNFFERGFDSFPSGHATATFALASFFSACYPRSKVTLYALAAIVSLGRVIYGHHFITDILAGAGLGIILGLFMEKKFREWISSSSESSPPPSPFQGEALSLLPNREKVRMRVDANIEAHLKSHLPNLLLIFIFSAITLFYGLSNSALWDRDETEFAQAVIEMHQKNEWLIPILEGQPFLEKPIFMYWLVRLSHLFIGVTEFSSRLPSAIFGILTCFATYFLAAAFGEKERRFFPD